MLVWLTPDEVGVIEHQTLLTYTARSSLRPPAAFQQPLMIPPSRAPATPPPFIQTPPHTQRQLERWDPETSNGAWRSTHSISPLSLPSRLVGGVDGKGRRDMSGGVTRGA
ncbi:hypothetical protein DPEC_G00022680 [Dallia pectoralis]|uniref:Uncharacterized protein n=1 Tax=Dallia pectoralis TaxID=75939 RepID=A0ACC2HH89_DALPE|nr:hypothetical protein DPEC_G00022680 [Dallia pectoralis]